MASTSPRHHCNKSHLACNNDRDKSPQIPQSVLCGPSSEGVGPPSIFTPDNRPDQAAGTSDSSEAATTGASGESLSCSFLSSVSVDPSEAATTGTAIDSLPRFFLSGVSDDCSEAATT